MAGRPDKTGQKYVYGYLNQVRSSRKLERECHRNLEVIWLMKKLAHDFKTIADFRKDNVNCIKPVFKEFVYLCRSLDLYGAQLVAIDGTKFKAVNSKSNNLNEKTDALRLRKTEEKIAAYLKEMDENDKADSDSDRKLREAVGQTVIPYPSNQKREVKDVLRVDKKFRTYGPDLLKKEYHKRPSVEAVYSFLKTQYSLATNKVRGLTNVACYALYSILCLILNREAAQNIGRPDKAVSPTYFNT